MPIDRDMFVELRAGPTPERYSVVADYLQTQGDPRGELIALDARARASGTCRDERADELELQLEYELRSLLADVRIKMTWERGFIQGLTVPSALIPEIRDCRWFHTDDLMMLHSLRIADRGGDVEDCQPIDLIAEAPFYDTLEHLAIGSHRSSLIPADQLAALVHRFPRLRSVELMSEQQLDDARLTALRQMPQIEALALWAPNDYSTTERLLSPPWQHLRALTLSSRGGEADTSILLEKQMRSRTDQNLVELALLDTGWDEDLLSVMEHNHRFWGLQRVGLDWHRISREAMKDSPRDLERIAPCPPDVELER